MVSKNLNTDAACLLPAHIKNSNLLTSTISTIYHSYPQDFFTQIHTELKMTYSEASYLSLVLTLPLYNRTIPFFEIVFVLSGRLRGHYLSCRFLFFMQLYGVIWYIFLALNLCGFLNNPIKKIISVSNEVNVPKTYHFMVFQFCYLRVRMQELDLSCWGYFTRP